MTFIGRLAPAAVGTSSVPGAPPWAKWSKSRKRPQISAKRRAWRDLKIDAVEK
jgi:hypothetical protein